MLHSRNRVFMQDFDNMHSVLLQAETLVIPLQILFHLRYNA